MYLELHPDSLEFIRFKRGSQKVRRSASPPIGKPRYIKGIEPTLQFKTIDASANQELFTFTPTRRLFEKFTFSPDRS